MTKSGRRADRVIIQLHSRQLSTKISHWGYQTLNGRKRYGLFAEPKIKIAKLRIPRTSKTEVNAKFTSNFPNRQSKTCKIKRFLIVCLLILRSIFSSRTRFNQGSLSIFGENLIQESLFLESKITCKAFSGASSNNIYVGFNSTENS